MPARRRLRLLAWLVIAFAVAAPALADPASDAESEIARLLDSEALAGTKIGLAVVDLDSNATLLSRGAGLPLVPASLVKLVTVASARQRMGADFRWTTRLVTDAPVEGDTLTGDLYLVGGGDPTLSTDDLARLADALTASGVHAVSGDLVADSGYFAPDRFDGTTGLPPYWLHTLPPISALSVDRNRLTLDVLPPTEPGGLPGVRVPGDPPPLTIRRELRVVGAGGQTKVEGRWASGAVYVRGQVAVGDAEVAVPVVATDPRALAAARFRQAAEAAGLKIAGGDRSDAAPENARTITAVRSKPLAAAMQTILKESDNFGAEMLLRTLGAEAQGAPGSTGKGLATVKRVLTERRVDLAGCSVVDGSGLSRANRLTARALTDLLVSVARDPDLMLDLITALPAAGEEGTLATRFTGEALPGVLLAKTGTLRGVACMAGYYWTPEGSPRAFAFLINDYPKQMSAADAARLQDRVVALLFGLETGGLFGE